MITSGCLADGLKNGYQLIFLSQLVEAIEWDVDESMYSYQINLDFL